MAIFLLHKFSLRNMPLDSLCDSVHSALEELNGKFQDEVNFALLMNDMLTFEKELRFLKLFLDWTKRWTDAEKVVPGAEKIVIKVQAKIQEIGSGFLANYKLNKNPFLKPFCKNLELVVWKENLSSCVKEIESLKQELQQVYSNPLMSNSILYSDLSDDFDDWKNCVESVKLIVNAKFLGLNLYSEIKGFVNLLDMITHFLDNLYVIGIKNLALMYHVESIVLQAASVFFQAWLVPMDHNRVKEMANVILDLGEEIDLSCSVEFVDMILVMFRRDMVPAPALFRVFAELVNAVRVRCQIQDYMPIRDSCWMEMIYLFTYMTDTPSTLQRFMGDVKILATEGEALRDDPVILLNLLAKVRLLQMEVFLVEQLKSLDVKGFDLQKALEDLKYRYSLVSSSTLTKVNDLERVMMIIKTVESHLESLKHSSYPQVFEAKMVQLQTVLFKLLLRALLLKAELLLGIFRKNETLRTPVDEGIKSISEGLKILTMFSIDLPKDVKCGKPLLLHIETFSRGVVTLCHTFPNGEVPEEMLQMTSLCIRALQDELKVIMIGLKIIYLSNVPWYDFPKAYPQDIVDKLLRNLKELIDFKSHLLAQVKHETEDILGHLKFLNSSITCIPQNTEVEGYKDVVESIVHIAYNVEYLIHTVVVGSSPQWCILLWNYHILQSITIVKAELEEVVNKQNLALGVHSISETPSQDLVRDYIPRTEEAAVGLNDEEVFIIDRLTRGSSYQDIISIIGMPGIGKTTLATKAYSNARVQYYFHICAWCYVSQKYRKTELLLDILSQVSWRTYNKNEVSDEELELKLYQCLKNKRYLIVMDDLWSTRAWEDLKRSLPDDQNGSRILVTTRLLDVALKIKPDSDPHSMSLLSDEESWDLLQRKVFHGAECPAELVEAGKLIASNCKGLPLSVVAIGGLLKRSRKSVDFWNEIAGNLSSHVINDPQAQCKDILGLSYNHLPNNLKVCFLYFSAFPGDKDIPVWKLKCLWIAEGFIPEIGTKVLEDVAENYLLDLINRSLVTVSKRKSNGDIKSCHMHDLLLDMCIAKTKEEKFLNLVKGIEEPYDGLELEYGLDFGFNQMSNVSHRTYKYYKDHRLCIFSKRRHFVMSVPRGPHVRTFLFFAMNDSYPRCPYDISFISHSFKLLKVLDLESLNMGYSFPSRIETLIHLRYLALSGDIDLVPSSIADLWNLETFIVRGLKGRVVLPGSVWCMAKLRHLHVTNLAMFNLLEVDELGMVSRLDSLVTLSSLFLPLGEVSQKILSGLPNLRKLRCILAEPGNPIPYELPRFDVLTELESLKILYYGKAIYSTYEFNFPLNLKTLSLSNFRLPWSNISVIGKLPSLEVLKLAARAFEGQEWEMREREFVKLKFLKLDTLNIVEWSACEDHLPNLQQLVLHNCKELQGVPTSFAYIPTLQIIQATRCGSMIDDSLRTIQEEEIEGLKIIINPTII